MPVWGWILVAVALVVVLPLKLWLMKKMFGKSTSAGELKDEEAYGEVY